LRFTEGKSGVAVILPTVNEAGTIRDLAEKILSLDGRIHIYVVDDGSTDGTLSIVRGIAESSSRLTLYERKNSRGLGDALRLGLRNALSEDRNGILVTLDADYSHDPFDIQRFLEMDADVVVGSRYIRGSRILGWSFPRRLMSMSANWLARFRLGIKVRDATSGYRAYSRRAAELVVSKSARDGFEFQVEAIWIAERADLRIVEVPIQFSERAQGSSKLVPLREITSMLSFLASPTKKRTAHT
jgi:dolichol-phosphate mannosyltransferase